MPFAEMELASKAGPVLSMTLTPSLLSCGGWRSVGLTISMVSDLDLLTFIKRSVPSVWALDLLLLVQRPPARTWSSRELIGELRASDAVVRGVLQGLQRDGLVAKGPDGRFRFAPAAELEELTVALAEAYAERPVAVINAIVSTDEKLQSLADAFRLTPPKP
jgi:hypothetical protein